MYEMSEKKKLLRKYYKLRNIEIKEMYMIQLKMAETFHIWNKSDRITPIDKKG